MQKITKNTIFRKSEEIAHHCIMDYTVEHNGYMGGDAGHGGYLDIVFETDYSTYWEVNGKVQPGRLSIYLEGDSEKEVFIKMLKNIVTFVEGNLEAHDKAMREEYEAKQLAAKK